MHSSTATALPSPARQTAAWPPIFAGLCASLVGIGLARFAYTPLIPPLIQAHWFSAPDVVYLGAANLAGYLVGALLGRPVAGRLGNVNTLRLMMVLVTAAFLACAFPVSVAWFFGWRLVSGIAGGAIMVLVAATVLPHVSGERRGLASGAMFLGLGLGIAGSGTIVPLLLQFGLRQTWIGLGAVAAVLTAASWFCWPSAPSATMSAATPGAAHKPTAAAPVREGSSMRLFYAEYALMALGLVPAMVFLVDFIARGLGAGAHLGSLFWVLYGLGAIAGPPLYGFLGDRLGARAALRWALLVQVLAVAGLGMPGVHLVFIAVLTIAIGSFPPGLVPLALARVHTDIPHDTHRQNVAWTRATTVFAAFQALSGYGYSALFDASGGDHRLVFLAGAAAFAVALAADLGVPWVLRRGAVSRLPAASRRAR
jgi:predicted MFS family arabinose efflux permease